MCFFHSLVPHTLCPTQGTHFSIFQIIHHIYLPHLGLAFANHAFNPSACLFGKPSHLP